MVNRDTEPRINRNLESSMKGTYFVLLYALIPFIGMMPQAALSDADCFYYAASEGGRYVAREKSRSLPQPLQRTNSVQQLPGEEPARGHR